MGKKTYCVQIFSSADWQAVKQLLKITDDVIQKYPINEYFECVYNNEKFIFYRSNGTKTTSAAAAQYAILTWKPEIIFILGTCGGVSTKLKKLDIIIANQTGHYDCDNKMTPGKGIFYEKTKVYLNNSWINFMSLPAVEEGIIGSADQDVSVENIDFLRNGHVDAADWGSASAAAICNLNKVPCCVALGITDLPDKIKTNSIADQALEYQKNAPIVMAKLINDILPVLLESFKSNYVGSDN